MTYCDQEFFGFIKINLKNTNFVKGKTKPRIN